MPRSGARSSSYDITLDGDLGLNLFRDGRQPAVQGGRFTSSEAIRSSGGNDQSVIFDRFTGGIGSTDRLIPHTYPLGIDVCTRFGRIWTPSGKITTLGTLPNGAGGRVPGQIRPNGIMEYGANDMLFGAGGVLVRTTYPFTSFTVETTVLATEEITSIWAYRGFIVLGTVVTATGNPGHLYVKDPGTGLWTSGDALGQFLIATYFKISGVGDWRLITNDTKYTFRYINTLTAAGITTAATWAAANIVGDESQPITNMVGAPLVMFFLKTDGLYHLEEDMRSARIADWSSSIHPDNGKVAQFAYGGVFASHGQQGIVHVDVADLNVQWQTSACAPGTNLGRVTPINGQATALTMDGEWLVAPIYNGTDSYIMYGRPNEVSQVIALDSLKSPQIMNWHGSEGTFFNQKVTAVDQASVGTNNRPLLWVASLVGSTPTISNISLAAKGATPLEDWVLNGPHRFQNNSWLYLPREDWGDDSGNGWQTAKKIFTRVDLWVEYLERDVTWIDTYMSTSNGYEIFWDRALDDTTLWHLVGRMDSTDRTGFVPGQSVQSGMHAATLFRGYAQDDKPFVFHSAKLRGVPVIEQQERRRYRVIVGRSRRPGGALDRRSNATINNRLEGLQWADPISLRDQHGLTYVVNFEEGYSYEEITDPQTKETIGTGTFTVRILRRPFIWGTYSRWGSDVSWS